VDALKVLAVYLTSRDPRGLVHLGGADHVGDVIVSNVVVFPAWTILISREILATKRLTL
jgi:hypothetical protein